MSYPTDKHTILTGAAATQYWAIIIGDNQTVVASGFSEAEAWCDAAVTGQTDKDSLVIDGHVARLISKDQFEAFANSGALDLVG